MLGQSTFQDAVVESFTRLVVRELNLFFAKRTANRSRIGAGQELGYSDLVSRSQIHSAAQVLK